jgi:GH35 family endo-1,4-beta-xylanase
MDPEAGFTDKYSLLMDWLAWIGSHSEHKRGAALLLDTDYRPKPVYEALRGALQSESGR